MNTENYVTLDQANEAFDSNRNANTAAQLIETAKQYWQDAMIADETLASKLRAVAYWLEFN